MRGKKMQEATTLKRVKPEPSDGTPANKRLKPDELERVVTPEGDSQQVEIDHVVDPETRAREAIRAAEAAGDIIDVDALDDVAPVVHEPATAPKEIVVKAEKLQQAKDATAARHAAEVAYQQRVWASDKAEAAPLGQGRTAKINCACVIADADAQHLEVGRAASGAGLAALRKAAPSLDSILRAGGGQLIAATATPLCATRCRQLITCCAVVESRPAVASSTKRTAGAPTSSIAMLSRRRSPNETPRCSPSPTSESRTRSSPRRRSVSSTSASRAAAGRSGGSLRRAAKRSDSITVSVGSTMSCSGTKPSSARCARGSTARLRATRP